jgi:hypothetical protein
MAGRYDDVSGVYYKVKQRLVDVSGIWKKVKERDVEVNGVWKKTYQAIPAWTSVVTTSSGGYPDACDNAVLALSANLGRPSESGSVTGDAIYTFTEPLVMHTGDTFSELLSGYIAIGSSPRTLYYYLYLNGSSSAFFSTLLSVSSINTSEKTINYTFTADKTINTIEVKLYSASNPTTSIQGNLYFEINSSDYPSFSLKNENNV